jgi:hypothetical protein
MGRSRINNSESRREARKQAACQREQETSNLSINERLARLDARLGVGVGATKERARLATLKANQEADEKATQEKKQKNKKKFEDSKKKEESR